MDSTDEALKKIAKGAGIFFIGIIISKLLGYFYKIAIARIGTEEYGLISLGLALTGPLVIVALLGLNNILPKYIPMFIKQNEQKLKDTISFSTKISFISGIFLAILVFLFADTIAVNIFHNPRLGIILKILSFSIPLTSLRNIFVGIMQGYKNVKWMVLTKEIGENLIKVVFTFIFIFLGIGFYGAAFAYILAMIWGIILAYILFKKDKIHVFSKIENYSIGKEILSHSWPLLFNSFLLMLITWIDTIMLGYFKTASLVGIYNAVIPTVFLFIIFPKAFNAVFLPVITSSYIENKESFKNIYKIVIKWIFLTNISLLFFILFFSKIVLKILFGNNYISGSTALIILSFGFFIQGLILFSSRDILILLKKTKIIFIITLFSVILDIILNYILIPIYSINGAALATTISLILMVFLVYILAYSNTRTNPFTIKYINIIFSALISIILTYIISLNFSDINLILCFFLAIFFLIIYLMLLLLTKCFGKEDLMIIEAIQKKSGLNFIFLNNLIKRFI